MKKVILLLFVLCNMQLFAISDGQLAKTIDLAGKQRMLTQKMMKESYMIALGLELNKSINSIKKSKELFDKTLIGLINGDKELGLIAIENKDIQNKLQKILQLWKPFKQNIEDIANFKATDEAYIFINRNNLKLLKEMNSAVLLYSNLNKESSKFKLVNDINLAGKERMLTQKIAKDILQIQFGVEQKKSLKDLKSSVKLFDNILNGLFNGDKKLHLNGTKLPKITNQLKVVKSHWKESKRLISSAIELKNRTNQDLAIKAIKSLDKVRKEMNRAVIYYTKSLNRHKQVAKLNQLISGFLKVKDNSKHIVNIAGKQRMLTQKISKLVIECSYKLSKNSCKKLKKATSLYDKTLNGFISGDKELNIKAIKNNNALEKIKNIKTIWRNFKGNINKIQGDKKQDKSYINYIVNNNEKLLKQSDQLVKILEKNKGESMNYIDKAMLNIINIAGRERMLTQKMTKEKISIIYLKVKDFKPKLKNSVKMFNDSLITLINGSKELYLPKATNPKIKSQLQKVNFIWEKLKPFYLKSSLSKKEVILLLKANPILLKEMDKAVSIIENSTEY